MCKQYIGISLSVTSTFAALVNKYGKILDFIEHPTRENASTESLFEDIVLICKKLIEQHHLNATTLHGIGIGVPGIIDTTTGIIQYSSHLKIKNFDVLTYMSAYLPFPINIANDADCVALGEAIVGGGKYCNSVVTFLIGTGVGGGIIIDKKIFTGNSPGSGEIGHQVIVKEGKLCICGNRGCLEAYISLKNLLESATTTALAHPDSFLCGQIQTVGKEYRLTLNILFDAAHHGDKLAISIIDRYLDYLAIGINNVISIFRPEKVLIAGKLSEQSYDFISPLTEKVRKHVFGGDLITQFELATLGINAQIIGAALLNEFTDVNHQIKIELETQENILRTIIDALPEDIFYKDRQGRFLGYNKNFGDFYKSQGITSILGKTELEISYNHELSLSFLKEDEEIMATKKSKRIESTVVDALGNPIICEKTKIPVIDKVGNVLGVVGMSRDISERKLIEKKLQYLSEIDHLTGLYNRHSFEEKVKQLNEEAFLPLGIIMGDVNGLKLVNDTVGHLEGDQLLKDISTVLKKVCQDKGYIFRWGGDEFVILLPQYDLQGCDEVIDQINYECKTYDSHLIELSIALGKSVKYNKEQSINELIKISEKHLYHKKLLEKKSINKAIFYSLKKNLEEKNIELERHTKKVTAYALAIGKQLNLSEMELYELNLAAELHDIGKIGICEEILLNPNKLSEDEMEIVKTHSDKGYRIVNACGSFTTMAKVILTHHEKWDGTGYPLGLKELEIPLLARIICVADAYAIMTSGAIYKKPIRKKDALHELQKGSGTQFDPSVVASFVSLIS